MVFALLPAVFGESSVAHGGSKWSSVMRLMSPLPLTGSLELVKLAVAGPTSLLECDRQTVCEGKLKERGKLLQLFTQYSASITR